MTSSVPAADSKQNLLVAPTAASDANNTVLPAIAKGGAPIGRVMAALSTAEAEENVQKKGALFYDYYMSRQPAGAFSAASSGFIGGPEIYNHWAQIFGALDHFQSRKVGAMTLGKKTEISYKIWTGTNTAGGQYRTTLEEALTVSGGKIASGLLDWNQNPFANVTGFKSGAMIPPATSLDSAFITPEAKQAQITAGKVALGNLMDALSAGDATALKALFDKHCQTSVLTPGATSDADPSVQTSTGPDVFLTFAQSISDASPVSFTPFPNEKTPANFTVADNVVLATQTWKETAADGSIQDARVNLGFSLLPSGKIGQFWVYSSQAPQ